MARQRRKPFFTPAFDRTMERVAIAALAAIATRGEGVSVAFAAITIFVIVAVGEELGRGWVWHGKRVTLRDVALGTVGELRLRRRGNNPGHRKRRRRTRARSGKRAALPGEANKRDG